MNLRIETEPVMAGVDATVYYACLAFVYMQYIYLTQKTDIYQSISSDRDRLGFYAEIQIIFGTVGWLAGSG